MLEYSSLALESRPVSVSLSEGLGLLLESTIFLSRPCHIASWFQLRLVCVCLLIAKSTLSHRKFTSSFDPFTKTFLIPHMYIGNTIGDWRKMFIHLLWVFQCKWLVWSTFDFKVWDLIWARSQPVKALALSLSWHTLVFLVILVEVVLTTALLLSASQCCGSVSIWNLSSSSFCHQIVMIERWPCFLRAALMYTWQFYNYWKCDEVGVS